METLEGRAIRVSSTIEVGGGQKYAPVSTTHLALFQLGSRMIRVSSDVPVMIGEGDQVLVVGVPHRGALEALAYRNLSTSAEGDQGWLAALVLGIALGVIGLIIVSMSFRPAPSPPVILAVVGAVFVPAGFYFAYRGMRVLAALTVLRRHPS